MYAVTSVPRLGDQSEYGRSALGRPAFGQSAFGQPEYDEAEADQPEADQPEFDQPEAGQPEADLDDYPEPEYDIEFSAVSQIGQHREAKREELRSAAIGSRSALTVSDEPAGESIAGLQARIRQMQGTRLDTRSIPTHPAIASLLPGGGLKQGAAYSVEQSTTLLMALLAGPSAAGSWCGVIGMPEFGVEAAANYGIDLDRLVLVPHPGDQWLAVTAAIADVMTVVVTRPPRQASDASVARLAARLRQRGSTLIVLGTWPQTDAMLSLSQSSWSGIGSGHGHLAAREVTVTVSTRSGARPQSARLWLPDRAAQFTSADQNGFDQNGADQNGVDQNHADQAFDSRAGQRSRHEPLTELAG